MNEDEETSLRDELEAAMTEDGDDGGTETPVETTAETAEEQPTRARDEKGRFVSTKEDTEETPTEVSDAVPETTEETQTEAQEEAAVLEALSLPANWSPKVQEHWAGASRELQEYITERENELHGTLTKHDEERNFGRSMYRTIQPYMAQIQAEGGTPETAVQELMNTAYVLRTGDPETKRQLILRTAQQFGVDLSNTELPEYSPEVASLQNRLNQLEGKLTQQQTESIQNLQDEINKEIEAFSQDPKNVHFAVVREEMSSLLSAGACATLEEAYDAACWSNPDVRKALLEQEKLEDEQKRNEEAKEKAEKARRKAVSVTGDRGTAVPTNSGKATLRDELESQFAASGGGV